MPGQEDEEFRGLSDAFTQMCDLGQACKNFDDAAVAANNARLEKCVELASRIGDGGFFQSFLEDQWTAATKMKKKDFIREASLVFLIETVSRSKAEIKFHPFFFGLLSHVLQLHADRARPVREAAAQLAYVMMTELPCAHELPNVILPIVEEVVGDEMAKWQCKQGCFWLLSTLAKSQPVAVAAALPKIIPLITETMWDTKQEVVTAATQAMTDVFGVVTNLDLVPFIPALVASTADPSLVPQTMEKLAATTFVAEVRTPTLSIVQPLLLRALAERSTKIMRCAALVTGNLCVLVREHEEAAAFVQAVRQPLDSCVDASGDEDFCEVGRRALAIIDKVKSNIREEKLMVVNTNMKVVRRDMAVLLKELAPSFDLEDSGFRTALTHSAGILTGLMDDKNYNKELWLNSIGPYMSPLFMTTAQALDFSTKFFALQFSRRRVDSEVLEEEVLEEGDVLCSVEFSLAYGALVLLDRARLHLVRGSRYGLCGRNGVGKSTLMRAISKGQLEGFPSPEDLKTIYVEHDIQGEEALRTPVQYITMAQEEVGVAKATQALKEVGFSDRLLEGLIDQLSGGWMMKLQLVRAMLADADILMLDEPTNHLDTANIEWIEKYLVDSGKTCMIVSHDSQFLNNVCTHIIHYEELKLKVYPGNLDKFIAAVPSAKTYTSLKAASYNMTFPKPGLLDGVRSQTRAICKVTDVVYAYPGAPSPTLHKVSCACALSSRIAVIGPNGAGKSTLIKVLTGEVLPQEGKVWRQPALRMAYVAQHAFHHVEQHLDKTANEYMQWRFSGGKDKEMLEKESRKFTEEDRAMMETPVTGGDGSTRHVECLLGRHKLKKSYEYEVKWKGMRHKHNTWMEREKLVGLGFGKLVQQCDDRESLVKVNVKGVTSEIIQEHFTQFGLDEETSTHKKIRGLSGGQKVKLVLAAAFWHHPHLIVFDEPTNYLDRDSLSALASGINTFEGGVLVISHNEEFIKATCNEKWHVEAGALTVQGKKSVQAEAEAAADSSMTEEERRAKAEAKAKAKASKGLTRKQKKELERQKAIAARSGKFDVDVNEALAANAQAFVAGGYGNFS